MDSCGWSQPSVDIFLDSFKFNKLHKNGKGMKTTTFYVQAFWKIRSSKRRNDFQQLLVWWLPYTTQKRGADKIERSNRNYSFGVCAIHEKDRMNRRILAFLCIYLWSRIISQVRTKKCRQKTVRWIRKIVARSNVSMFTFPSETESLDYCSSTSTLFPLPFAKLAARISETATSSKSPNENNADNGEAKDKNSKSRRWYNLGTTIPPNHLL